MKKIFLFLLFITSCSLLDGDKKEAIIMDSPPPADYNPIFIKNIKDYSQKSENLSVNISKINYDGNKTTAFVHLIDSMQTLLSNANLNSDIWCEVIDSTSQGMRTISPEISEINFDNAAPVALTVIMDLSGSMGEERAKVMQRAVAKFIADKRPLDKIGLIRYDNNIVLRAEPTTDQNILYHNHTVDGLQGFGKLTATRDAILEGIESLKDQPSEYRRAIIVFTDGKDNSSKKSVDDVVEQAKLHDIFVSTIDYSYYVGKGMLESIANKSGGIYHHIYSTNEFNYVFEDLYKRLNNSYKIDFNTEYFGKHKIKLKLCIEGKEYFTSAEFDNTPIVGKKTLLNVYFDHNKSKLKSESQNTINMLVDYLKRNPHLDIELHGYTDNTGKPDYNMQLSEKRANSVKQNLIDAGIDKNRISAFGHGIENPIATNDTEEGRSKNRRTEFVLKNG